MTSTLYSFLNIAWKLGLGFVAFTCGSQSFLLHAQAKKAQSDVKLLTERVQRDQERMEQEIETRQRVEAEIDFWRRMETLARREIDRKDRVLQEINQFLKDQTERARVLESKLAGLAERERALRQECDHLRGLVDKQEGIELDSRASLTTSPISDVTLTQVPDSDVIQMVRTLNNEISRAATLLTNAFRVSGERHGEGFAEVYERTRQTVGPIMAELLESVQHQEDPILVHVALQTDMIGFAAELISAWDFQHSSNSVFAGIYKQMLTSESQEVAGRWRALTRKHSKQRLYNGRDLTEDFTHQLAERMSAIFIVSGANNGSEIVDQTSLPSLESIIRLSLDLQMVVGEQIISGDFEVSVVRVDEVYDPELMEDLYAEENAHHDSPEHELHVLCTASLGLRRSEKASGMDDPGMLTALLLKPKVVLETLVYDLGLLDEDGDGLDSESNSWAS